MERQTSFAHQKSVLERFLSLTTEFETNFKELILQYEKEINTLYEKEGLMEEIYNDYKSLYLDSMKNSLSDILIKIPEENVSFIEKEIEFISSR